jgi:hypothetical protein
MVTCSSHNGLFALWGRAVRSRGTGCSLFEDGLFTPGGRAVRLWGRAVRFLGTSCSLYGDGLFPLWGRAVRSMGTGCSLYGDGLFTPGGRAVRSRGKRSSNPLSEEPPPTDKPGI